MKRLKTYRDKSSHAAIVLKPLVSPQKAFALPFVDDPAISGGRPFNKPCPFGPASNSAFTADSRAVAPAVFA